MSKLQIEQLTDQVQLEKTAEEAEMEKIASVLQVIDQASVLTTVGEELFKVAEELENENLAVLAQDIYQTGERMGSALTKMASENGSALEEGFDIAEDLNKLATVMAEIADDIDDENFSKMAEAVIEISNDLTDEANEAMEEFGDVEKEAGEKGKAIKAFFKRMKESKVGKAFRATEARDLVNPDTGTPGVSIGLKAKLKKLATKEGLKSMKDPAIAYGSTAAALAAAGYGAKKMHHKK
jgi:predicted metal-dependent phosphoesterase TrpH